MFVLCNAGLNGWKAPWRPLLSVVVRCLVTEDMHRKIRNMPVVLFLSVERTAQQIFLLRIISGFRCELDEYCARLGYCAEIGNSTLSIDSKVLQTRSYASQP
jgi:hypothetical protein